MQWYKDNSYFTKEILPSFIEVATPHKESSLMGAKGGGPSTCPRSNVWKPPPRVATKHVGHIFPHML
jgi:hypothetical protein